MTGEMYRYLSKAIERMAKQNVRKNAKMKYREKYKLGVVCDSHFRIHEMGDAGSWAPQREVKLLAVQKAMEGEFDLVRQDLKQNGTGGAAFLRGAADGTGISLNRQAAAGGIWRRGSEKENLPIGQNHRRSVLRREIQKRGIPAFIGMPVKPPAEWIAEGGK
jgi:hypothetical protein